MSKNSPAVPTPADPTTVANAQTASNIGTSTAQQQENLINQTGPAGSVTYDQTGTYVDPTTGLTVPKYTQDTELSPLGNTLLGAGTNVANSVLPTIQQEASNIQPLNVNSGVNAATVAGGPQATNSNVANAVYGEQSGFLNPQWQQNQQNLTDQLSQQGIPVGSQAYDNAMTNFNNSKTQAYQAAQDSATTQGSTAGSNLYNMALLGQQQNVANQQTAQQNPISLLSLLTSGYGIGGSS